MSPSLFDNPAYAAGLDEVEQIEADKARMFAREAGVLARLQVGTTRDGWTGEAPIESVMLEVAGTARIGQNAAAGRMQEAEHLVQQLPKLLELLREGVVYVPQAKVLLRETESLDAAMCARVESRVLAEASRLSPGRLRALVKRVVAEESAAEEIEQAEQARQSRRVWKRAADEPGMALLMMLAPAEEVDGLFHRLTEQARALGAAGDERTADQLRSDLLCAAGTGSADPRPRVEAVIEVPVAVALGLSDAPGRLVGHGPLPASVCRLLIPGAALRLACVDAQTGELLHLAERAQPAGGPEQARERLVSMISTSVELLETSPELREEPHHDPSTLLARFVRAHQRQCDGIGCSMPADRCEIDHHIPWPTGPTSAANNTPRSQRCHHAKHAGWTVIKNEFGDSTWVAPSGRRYLVPAQHYPPPPITRKPKQQHPPQAA